MMVRLRNEDGMTIIEVTVVLAMFLAVLGTFLGLLDSVNRGLAQQQQRSQANDQVRLAIEQMDREIRSGNVLYDPATETPATDRYYTLRVFTQANAPTRIPPLQCVQWRISDQTLIRRAWPSGDPGGVTDWRIVAENIVNREQGVEAFTLDPDPAKGGRIINVVLIADVDTDESVSRPVRVQTALTGRNTTYNFGSDVCDPKPAG